MDIIDARAHAQPSVLPPEGLCRDWRGGEAVPHPPPWHRPEGAGCRWMGVQGTPYLGDQQEPQQIEGGAESTQKRRLPPPVAQGWELIQDGCGDALDVPELKDGGYQWGGCPGPCLPQTGHRGQSSQRGLCRAVSPCASPSLGHLGKWRNPCPLPVGCGCIPAPSPWVQPHMHGAMHPPYPSTILMLLAHARHAVCMPETGCTWHPKARHGAGHGAARGDNHQSIHSQHQEHQEEEDGPERGAGQQGEGFRVCHKRQPGACGMRRREV